MNEKPKKIIIEGITAEKERFRPSDWAERLSGRLATYKNHRIRYSPLLRPTQNHQGYKCIVVDPSLEQSNEQLFQSILEFAVKNNLNITHVDDESP